MSNIEKRKVIRYPHELHQDLVKLLGDDIAAAKQAKPLNQFIVEILQEFVNQHKIRTTVKPRHVA